MKEFLLDKIAILWFKFLWNIDLRIRRNFGTPKKRIFYE